MHALPGEPESRAASGCSTDGDGYAGIGLRQPHFADLLQGPTLPLPFVEVHSENFFGEGGAALAALRAARERWPVSLHGVGLALGSATGLDPWHLDQLAELVERIDPVRVSDHACFARAPLHDGSGLVVHAADLLPLACTDATLDIMARHVDAVQQRLKRRILVENIAAYVRFGGDTLAEPEFFNQLVQRTGCGVLLDVNNLVVNALNAQRAMRSGEAETAQADGPGAAEQEAAAVSSACSWLDALETHAVGELHLAGYHDAGALVIDDHGSRVHPPVWQVFEHALTRWGAVPTLLEWDTDLPPLSVLLAEAQAAGARLARQARTLP